MHGWFFFWLIPLFFFAMVSRRRRWQRWAMMGPQGEMMWSDGWRYRDRYDEQAMLDRAARRELGQQQEYIEALESRVAELEARLDFTEKLIGQKPETP